MACYSKIQTLFLMILWVSIVEPLHGAVPAYPDSLINDISSSLRLPKSKIEINDSIFFLQRIRRDLCSLPYPHRRESYRKP